MISAAASGAALIASAAEAMSLRNGLRLSPISLSTVRSIIMPELLAETTDVSESFSCIWFLTALIRRAALVSCKMV